LTSELERIKILEGKISHVVDYVNKLIQENEKLKQQVRELKTEKKDFEEQARKAGKFGEDLKKYEKEREIIKEKIETVINQIDQLGI
jgi:cell division septum initiation protein DivIVA